jgi:Trypsin-like peptidase domain
LSAGIRKTGLALLPQKLKHPALAHLRALRYLRPRRTALCGLVAQASGTCLIGGPAAGLGNLRRYDNLINWPLFEPNCGLTPFSFSFFRWARGLPLPPGAVWHINTLMRSLLVLAVAVGFQLEILAGPREIAAQAFPSVVMIVTDDSHGQALAIGSGFFVRENVIASNAHVIEGAVGGYAKLVGQDKEFDLRGALAMDRRNDIVLLAVDGAKAPALKLGDSGKLAVGDRVYSVGNPKGLEGTFAEGIVSGIRDADGEKLLQITAPISPGSSGGPILDASGAVVGVAVATFRDGQNLNFAIPAAKVSVLLTNIGAITPLSGLKPSAPSKSALEALGRDSREGITVGSFIWTDATLEFVVRNHVKTPVTNVKILFVFRDESGEPCDSKEVTWPTDHSEDLIKVPSAEDMKNGAKIEIVPQSLAPGMAKPGSVAISAGTKLRAMKTRPEVRILGFDILKADH